MEGSCILSHSPASKLCDGSIPLHDLDHLSKAQLAECQLSRSHNSVTFTRVDTQDYASNTCDIASM